MAQTKRPRKGAAAKKRGVIGFDAAAEAFRQECQSAKRPFYEYDLEYLARFFGKRPVSGIQVPSIVDYRQQRRNEAAAAETINDELRTLNRILLVAVKHGWLLQCPPIAFEPELRMTPEPVRSSLLRRRPALVTSAPPSPVGRPTVKAAPPPHQPVGRRPDLTDDKFRQHLADVPPGRASDPARARILTNKLGRPISRDQVARARNRLGIPPFSGTSA